MQPDSGDPISGRRSDYAYALGIYLGDGSINAMPRTYRLRIALDAAYPEVVAEAQRRLASVLPDNRVSIYPVRHARCVFVVAHSKFMPELFPWQMKGRKHESTLPITRWQKRIVHDQPAEFLRGFFHADGSLSRNIVKGKNYPRYFFKNESAQILDQVRKALDRLAVSSTTPAYNVISVARKQDVAVLRDVCGMKS